jgi:hypothetical protein
MFLACPKIGDQGLLAISFANSISVNTRHLCHREVIKILLLLVDLRFINLLLITKGSRA